MKIKHMYRMLQTGPYPNNGYYTTIMNRWYVNGKRVSKTEFNLLNEKADRKDTFYSYKKGNRYFATHYCYMIKEA